MSVKKDLNSYPEYTIGLTSDGQYFIKETYMDNIASFHGMTDTNHPDYVAGYHTSLLSEVNPKEAGSHLHLRDEATDLSIVVSIKDKTADLVSYEAKIKHGNKPEEKIDCTYVSESGARKTKPFKK